MFGEEGTGTEAIGGASETTAAELAVEGATEAVGVAVCCDRDLLDPALGRDGEPAPEALLAFG